MPLAAWCVKCRAKLYSGQHLDHQAISQRPAPPTNPEKKGKKVKRKSENVTKVKNKKRCNQKRGSHKPPLFTVIFVVWIGLVKMWFSSPKSMRCNQNKTGSFGGSSVHLSSTHHPNGARDLPNAFGVLIETWEYVFRNIPFWGVQSKQTNFEWVYSKKSKFNLVQSKIFTTPRSAIKKKVNPEGQSERKQPKKPKYFCHFECNQK